MKLGKTVVEKIDRREWDFSTVPPAEECGCCIFEWARESNYIRKELDRSTGDFAEPSQPVENDKQREALNNSLIVHALPGKGIFYPNKVLRPTERMKELLSQSASGGLSYENFFDKPWLARTPAWRAEFCRNLKKCWDGLHFARILNKKPYGGFHLGMSQFFNRKLWTGDEMRRFDPERGLETLMVAINWHDFTDLEIIEDFTKWLESSDGRPPNVGRRSDVGKNKISTWRVELERLAIVRLRHYYSFDEIAYLLPERWADMEKFQSSSEAGRERRAALQTFFELHPFLPKQTRPRSWCEA